jgi:hypothetical protein
MRFVLATLAMLALNLSALAQVNTLSGPLGDGYPILLEPPLVGGLNTISSGPPGTACLAGAIDLSLTTGCNLPFYLGGIFP